MLSHFFRLFIIILLVSLNCNLFKLVSCIFLRVSAAESAEPPVMLVIKNGGIPGEVISGVDGASTSCYTRYNTTKAVKAAISKDTAVRTGSCAVSSQRWVGWSSPTWIRGWLISSRARIIHCHQLQRITSEACHKHVTWMLLNRGHFTWSAGIVHHVVCLGPKTGRCGFPWFIVRWGSTASISVTAAKISVV